MAIFGKRFSIIRLIVFIVIAIIVVLLILRGNITDAIRNS